MKGFTAILSGLMAGLTLVSATPAEAKKLKAPDVPAAIEVPAGNEVFMEGHAVGSQNYICLPSGGAYAWTLFTPEAELSKDNGDQLATHFFSPNPSEPGSFRATWLHSRDSSKFWGKAVATSKDANYVSPGAIVWVLLQAVGSDKGGNGGDTMTQVTYVQRVNTTAGAAPADGCAAAADVGKKAIQDYSADYYFFRADDGHGDD